MCIVQDPQERSTASHLLQHPFITARQANPAQIASLVDSSTSLQLSPDMHLPSSAAVVHELDSAAAHAATKFATGPSDQQAVLAAAADSLDPAARMTTAALATENNVYGPSAHRTATAATPVSPNPAAQRTSAALAATAVVYGPDGHGTANAATPVALESAGKRTPAALAVKTHASPEVVSRSQTASLKSRHQSTNAYL